MFVFAIQTCCDPTHYNPLDLGQWEFRVMPASIIEACRTKSFGMGFVRKNAPAPLTWDELHAAVASAARVGET